MIPEDYKPSRDVMRLVQQIQTKDGLSFVLAAQDFYPTLEWVNIRSVLLFFEHFEPEIVRMARKLDVTCSLALGIALVIAAQRHET